MNYGKIYNFDTANGPGLRVTLFVSGCRHHCPGCFNPETWDFCYGKPFTFDTISRICALLAPDHIQGLSILGGEPMEPENQPWVAILCATVKALLPQKSIWLYTGYSFERFLYHKDEKYTQYTDFILNIIDVLVDGAFEEDKKDITLKFRGSSNQRILDSKTSLELQRAIWMKGYN